MPAKSAATQAAAEGKPVLAPEQADALKQVAKREEATAKAISSTVRAWFDEYIHNSPVSRDVHSYNHLLASLVHLETALAGAVKKEL